MRSPASILLVAGLLACTVQPQPLVKPLAPELALPGGLRVAVLDADLPALAETVRLAAGKTVDIAMADWPLDDASQGAFAFVPAGLALTSTALVWQAPQRLKLTAHLDKAMANLSLTLTGQAGCGLTWQTQGATVDLTAEVVRGGDGALLVQAAGAPVVQWQGATLADKSGCLATLTSTQTTALAAHIAAEWATQISARLAKAYHGTLATVFAGSLEQSGRVALATPSTDPLEARFAVQYLEAEGRIATHVGALGQANLSVSLDVDRHPCAVDVALPTAVVGPLPQRQPPAGQAFLRRALVLDQALVTRLAWAAARSGALCAQARSTLTTTLAPGWAGDLLPQVDEWIEGPPTSARFWPGSSPTTRFVDTPAGPAIEWTMADAQLEIIARVADTEMTVLTVTGGFRATLLPHLQAPHALGFDLVSVERLATHQSSPLLGDLATPPSEVALSALCESALQGIFAQQAVLPLLPLSPGLLPPGTVLTRVDRTGDALWLWLEGGQVQ